MTQKGMQRVMQSAVVLTIVSSIAKVLSAFYRVPSQGFIGDEGFYVYQQVYPIYGIAMTLALSGLPQFISKIVAEQPDIRDQEQALCQLYPYVLWLAVACQAFFFSGGQGIVISMGDAALRPLVEVVSFTFLLVPILPFYHGNFQDHLLMVSDGISQVMEQFVRVGVVLVAALSYHCFGDSIYQAGTVATSDALAGGVLAVLVLWYYNWRILSGSAEYLRQWKITS